MTSSPELVPLFVDLDGTLMASDTLFESALSSLKSSPWDILTWPLWLASGRARLKSNIAASSNLDASRLPYLLPFCEYLKSERQRGRRIFLATAADRSIATAVSDHLGLFDGVIASDGIDNLKGAKKLQAIRRQHEGPFVYAGNSTDDLPIWAGADSAIIVTNGSRLSERVSALCPVEKVFDSGAFHLGHLIGAMRPYQWIKNTLIFVPLLTSFQFGQLSLVSAALMAFVAFSLCASATYILNDLMDLDADRAHPRKRLRPFAAGRVPIPAGIAAMVALYAGGLLAAGYQSNAVFYVLLAYIVTSNAYSLRLKHYLLMDSVVLAALYTVRMYAGSVATGIEVSVWLLAFSLFVFVSLALLKRCAELVTHESGGRSMVRGRAYRVADLRVLWPLGVATSVSAVVVFVLYSTDPLVRARYNTPAGLWMVAVGLVYWLGRLWLKTNRGEMTDDPIVFALKDYGSRVTVLAMIMITLAAHVIDIRFLT